MLRASHRVRAFVNYEKIRRGAGLRTISTCWFSPLWAVRLTETLSLPQPSPSPRRKKIQTRQVYEKYRDLRRWAFCCLRLTMSWGVSKNLLLRHSGMTPAYFTELVPLNWIRLRSVQAFILTSCAPWRGEEKECSNRKMSLTCMTAFRNLLTTESAGSSSETKICALYAPLNHMRLANFIWGSRMASRSEPTDKFSAPEVSLSWRSTFESGNLTLLLGLPDAAELDAPGESMLQRGDWATTTEARAAISALELAIAIATTLCSSSLGSWCSFSSSNSLPLHLYTAYRRGNTSPQG